MILLPIRTTGLSPEDLTKLLKVICDPYIKLTTTERSRIIRSCLYFYSSVPSECVYIVCSTLGVTSPANGKRRLARTLQVNLVNWLICVHPLLEDRNVIGRLYCLLFHFLEYEYLRPKVAQLLFLSTKRHHVIDSRINTLLNIFSKNVGSSREIVALALLFRQYRPTEVLDTFPPIASNVFNHPDEEYLQQLISLRGDDKLDTQSELRYITQFGGELKRRKQRGSSTKMNFTESSLKRADVTTMRDFVQMFSQIQTPNDWTTIMDDTYSLLAHLLKGGESKQAGLNNFIVVNLHLFSSLHPGARRTFLESMKQFVSLTQSIPPSLIEHFMMDQELLSKENAPYLWNFLQNFTIVDHLDELELVVKLYNGLSIVQETQWVAFGYLDCMSTLFQHAFDEGIELERINELYQSVVKILPTVLKNFGYDRSLGLVIINFIKLLQRCEHPERLAVHDIVLPRVLIYSLLFMDDSIIFSEVCGHLNFCKGILKDTLPSAEVTTLTNLHNSYVVDICNLIWRNRAFELGKLSTTSFGLTQPFTHAFSATVPIFDKNSNFKSLFNLHHTPAFASLTANILRELEDKDPNCVTRHEGPLTPTSVMELLENVDVEWLPMDYEDVRVEVLRGLGKVGYTGLSDLLFSHLKSLLDRR